MGKIKKRMQLKTNAPNNTHKEPHMGPDDQTKVQVTDRWK